MPEPVERIRTDRKKSLLEQATELSGPAANDMLSATEIEEAELCIAWVMGAIDSGAVAQVLGKRQTGAVASRVATVLRNCARAGRLALALKDPPYV